MFKIELQWKQFNVDLAALDQQLRSSHSNYVGNQAHAVLELWFNEEPSGAQKEEIQAIWANLDEVHALAQSYKSAAQIAESQAARKASAKAKLAALGLTEAEIEALLGN